MRQKLRSTKMEHHSTVYNFSEWRMFKHFDESDFMWDFLAFGAYNARKKLSLVLFSLLTGAITSHPSDL